MSTTAEPDRAEFARELDTLRQRAGLTIRQVAKLVDAPHGTVGGYFSGRHFPSPSQTDLFIKILTSCGVQDPAEIQQWVDTLVRVRRRLGRRPTTRTAPYLGLESFQPEHGDWFFGREALIETLVHQLFDRPAGLLMVVGPSGCGKSSLLGAGLGSALNDVEATRFLLMTPGAHPERALAEALGEDGAGTGLVLVVDQFEETFTLCRDAAEQQAFVKTLSAMDARVVVGMRADFYAQALRHAPLADALQNTQVVVRPMSEDELRRAIVEPARKANIDLEDGLVELLVHDLGAEHDPGALPMLSHALLATWEHGSRSRMTVEDYRASGGIAGAVAQTAEAVFAQLTAGERDAARRLFLRLVHVGEDTAVTRRRVHREELIDNEAERVLDSYVERRLITVDADTVGISHEALIQAWPRLRGWVDADRASLRLHRHLTESAQAWHEGDRDPDALYRGARLATVTEWVRDGNHQDDLNALERDFLAASVERDQIEQARARRRTRHLYQILAALAVLTLLAGTMAVVALEQRSMAANERDLAISRQVAITANRLREGDPALAAQLSLAAYRISPTIEARSSLIASSGAPMVTRMVRPGGARQVVAVSRDGRLLAAGGATEAVASDTAVLLWDMTNPQSPRRIGEPLTGHTGPIYAVAFSPDGRTMATGSTDNTVRLWNVSDPARATPHGAPLTGAQGRILGLDFSPDNRILAASGADKTVRLWDISNTPVPLGSPLQGAAGAVQAVSFRPDGFFLAAADSAGSAQLWDIRDPLKPHVTTLPVSSRVNVVAFSPDGTTLAVGSNDRMVRFWNVSPTGAPTPIGEPLTAATGWVYAVSFSADGKTIAVGNAASSVQLWDWRHRRLIVSLAHPEPVTAVALRHDDRLLVTNSVDGIARVWTVPGPSIPAADRTITTVSFNPRGTLLASAGTDVQLAALPARNQPSVTGPALTAPEGFDRIGGTVAISPDGRTLVADTRKNNAIVLWDITNPGKPTRIGEPLMGHTAQTGDISFSRDGRLLATASEDGTARLWDVTDPHKPISLGPLKTPDESSAFEAVFTPDSNVLAVATSVGSVTFWDVTDPSRPVAIGAPLAAAPDIIYAVAFSPDGRVFATGSSDGLVRLWDLSERKRPRLIGEPITGLDGHIQTLAYSPDGALLAGGNKGDIRIWDVTDPGRPQALISMDRARQTTWSVAFSPDGHTLAAASGDVRLWDVDAERVAAEICATAGDPMSETEWRKHVPGAEFRAACPA